MTYIHLNSPISFHATLNPQYIQTFQILSTQASPLQFVSLLNLGNMSLIDESFFKWLDIPVPSLNPEVVEEYEERITAVHGLAEEDERNEQDWPLPDISIVECSDEESFPRLERHENAGKFSRAH
jgi:hypothetical protein